MVKSVVKHIFDRHFLFSIPSKNRTVKGLSAVSTDKRQKCRLCSQTKCATKLRHAPTTPSLYLIPVYLSRLNSNQRRYFLRLSASQMISRKGCRRSAFSIKAPISFRLYLVQCCGNAHFALPAERALFDLNLRVGKINHFFAKVFSLA